MANISAHYLHRRIQHNIVVKGNVVFGRIQLSLGRGLCYTGGHESCVFCISVRIDHAIFLLDTGFVLALLLLRHSDSGQFIAGDPARHVFTQQCGKVCFSGNLVTALAGCGIHAVYDFCACECTMQFLQVLLSIFFWMHCSICGHHKTLYGLLYHVKVVIQPITARTAEFNVAVFDID